MSIGNTMQESKGKTLKSYIYLAGIIVYITAILYAEVHGYTLLVSGIDPGLLIWAIAGIFALGITALALPLGLHYAFFDSTQRMTAFLFYGLDLALLMLNAVIDYLRFQAGGEMPGWGTIYLEYVVPLNPVIAGLGWSILLLMDPHQKRKIAFETLRAAAEDTLTNAIAEQAKAAKHNEAVDRTAGELVDSILTETLNGALGQAAHQLPARTITRTERQALEAKPTDKDRRKWQIFMPRRRHPEKASSSNGAGPNPTSQQPG